MFPLNLPNTLTVIRILLVPVVVVALLDETPNGDAIAAGVFALAALTDTLDGYIARQRDAVTTFGKLMDPIADKLLIAASLIARSPQPAGGFDRDADHHREFAHGTRWPAVRGSKRAGLKEDAPGRRSSA